MKKRFIRIIKKIPKTRIKIEEINNSAHALITRDSIKTLSLFPKDSVDLIITDPPYNRGIKYGKSKDRMKKDEYYDWCKKWLKECARILGQNGTFYLISYPENNARLLSYIEDELKLKFKRWITWHYPTNIGHSKRNFTRSQRSILYFVKGKGYNFYRQNILQPYKNPTVSKIKKRMLAGSKGRASYDVLGFLDLIELDNKIKDVLKINLLKNTAKDRYTGLHPCQLPLKLLEILVKVSSRKGNIILDPFAGTFTLSAVAAKLGRNSIGIDNNSEYVKLGLKRLNNEKEILSK